MVNRELGTASWNTSRKEEETMIKMLVSIDANLASSIALRYTCQVAKNAEVDIQTIHVHESGARGLTMGSGWARRTWEKQLVEEGKKEISSLLVAESSSCPILKEPLVLSGDHDKEILQELQRGQYDLYVEGSPTPLNPRSLAKRIESRVYQQAACPVLQVPNLLTVAEVLCVIRDAPGCRCIFTTLQRLFSGIDLKVDISLSSLREAENTSFQEGDAQKMAGEFGWVVRNTREFHGKTDSLVKEMKSYGLIVVALDRPTKTRNSLVEFLGELSLPTLFCWR
jgi:hypothetical protein